MAEKTDLTLSVSGDALKELKKITKQTESFEKQVKKSNSFVKNSFETLTGVLGAQLVAKGFNVAINAARSFIDSIKNAAQAAIIQENAIAKLNQALALTGEFTEETSQSMQDFAAELQSVSTIGDEVILDQLALAKSFGLTNEQAQDLLKAAVDLSAATGISLESAVKNLGKTTSGLTGELGEVVPALKNFTQEELKAGKAIDFVNQRFAGSAQALTKTFGGALQQAGNILGDFGESIGSIITQNPQIIAGINAVSEIFKELTSAVTDSRGTFSGLLSDMILFAVDLIPGINSGIFAMIDTFQELRKGIIATIGGINQLLGQTEDAEKAFQDFNEIVQQQRKTEEVFTKINDIVSRVSSSMRSASEESNKMGQSFTNTGTASKELSVEMIQLAEQGKALANIFSSEKLQEQFTQRMEVLTLALETEMITRGEFAFQEQELQNQRFEQELAALTEALNQKKITQEQFNNAIIGLEEKKNLKIAQSEKKLADFKAQQEQAKLQAVQGALGQISSLQRSGSKELFEIGKAAAIANATISGFEAIQKAWAIGPPLAFALVPLVTASVLANISSIGSQNLAFQAGGIVPGTSFSGDRVNAQVNSGELILNRAQQKNVANQLVTADASQNRDILVGILDRLDRLQNSVIVNVGGREIFNEIRDQLNGGRVFAT